MIKARYGFGTSIVTPAIAWNVRVKVSVRAHGTNPTYHIGNRAGRIRRVRNLRM
jgi:hypothetical protein